MCIARLILKRKSVGVVTALLEVCSNHLHSVAGEVLSHIQVDSCFVDLHTGSSTHLILFTLSCML